MIIFFISILQILIITYLGWGALYQFIYAFTGHFYKNTSSLQAKTMRRMAIFIPAYKEDKVIIQTARLSLMQDYPQDRFDVIVIADSMQESTMHELSDMPIKLLSVSFEQSTKSRALNKALENLPKDNYDVAVILDGDNIPAPDFLRRINAAFDRGAHALQGRRAAKNSHTGIALLDAASEDTNTHILCRGHRVLGLSARLAGSGMAFDFKLFSAVMPLVDALGGFDKEMELRLTQAGIEVEYDELAVVYDEKVGYVDAFANQRSRWIAAQFRYFGRFGWSGFKAFFSGNRDFFNKSLQMALPPRLLLPGFLAFGFGVNLFFGTPFVWPWGIAMCINMASWLMAMPRYCFDRDNFIMWSHIPAAFFATLRALMKLKAANKEFLHTVHGEHDAPPL